VRPKALPAPPPEEPKQKQVPKPMKMVEAPPPVRKEPAPALVEKKKPTPRKSVWEEEVDALSRDGRHSDALKVMQTRAKAIGDEDALRCAYDGVMFASAGEVAKCARILREAELKR